ATTDRTLTTATDSIALYSKHAGGDPNEARGRSPGPGKSGPRSPGARSQPISRKPLASHGGARRGEPAKARGHRVHPLPAARPVSARDGDLLVAGDQPPARRPSSDRPARSWADHRRAAGDRRRRSRVLRLSMLYRVFPARDGADPAEDGGPLFVA